jgi:signal transduction histidine kinase
LIETGEYREIAIDLEKTRILQLEAQIAELRLLTGWIVHDIAGPLRAVNGMASIVLEEHCSELSDDAKDLLQRQKNASRNAIHLMESLKLMLRCDAAPIQRRPVDVSAIVHELAAEIAESHDPRPVFHIESDLVCSGDALYVRFLLQNLLDNATRHNDSLLPEVWVGRSASNPAVFFVRDNGTGFDIAELQRIFRPFERGNGSSSSGLGLAIVSRIVQWHEGGIWAESTPGRGSTFWFSLG